MLFDRLGGLIAYAFATHGLEPPIKFKRLGYGSFDDLAEGLSIPSSLGEPTVCFKIN